MHIKRSFSYRPIAAECGPALSSLTKTKTKSGDRFYFIEISRISVVRKMSIDLIKNCDLWLQFVS